MKRNWTNHFLERSKASINSAVSPASPVLVGVVAKWHREATCGVFPLSRGFHRPQLSGDSIRFARTEAEAEIGTEGLSKLQMGTRSPTDGRFN